MSCSQVEFMEVPLSEAELLVEQGIQRITKRIDVKAVPQIDVLLVVDNSGSMAEEQRELSNKISGLISKIQHLNWQLTIITTDVYNRNYGQALPLSSPLILSSKYNLAEANSMLIDLINVGTGGDGDERGIASMMAHIRKDLSQPNPQFHRASSTLVTVLLSDEDECSDGYCVKTSPDSQPENVKKAIQDLFAAKFGQSKSFRFHSLIDVPGSSSCVSGNNKDGNIYQQMAQLTDGITGSICASDYLPVLTAIGQDSVQLVSQIDLSCSNPQVRIVNEITHLPIDQAFVVEGTQLKFAVPLSPGSYTVTQDCPL